MNFDDLLDLESNGLIKLAVLGLFNVSFDSNPLMASYQGQSYSLTLPEVGFPWNTGNVLLTSAGIELFPIIDCQLDEEFKNSTVEEWRSRGWEVAETNEVRDNGKDQAEQIT